MRTPVRASARAVAPSLGKRLASLVMLALMMLATPATAVTILRDAEGDVQTTEPAVPGLEEPSFRHVDVRLVDASELGDTLDLRITFSSDVTDQQAVTVAFDVRKGPDSLPDSKASGLRHTLTYEAGEASGPAGTSGAAEGPVLLLRVPLLAIGAVGGDLLTNLTVAATATDEGVLPAPATQDDTTGTDSAPDSGASTPYRFARAPVKAGIALVVTSARVEDANGTHGGPRSAEQTAAPGKATAFLTVQVANTGTDPDVVTLANALDHEFPISFVPGKLSLAAGQTGVVDVTFPAEGTAGGAVTSTLLATSARGGTERLPLSIRFVAPPAAPERDVKPAGLGFLTPAATAMGLDGAFGSYAELALLLFVLLLVVAGVFLALALVRTPWVRVKVSPSLVVATPGSVAEFRIQMGKAKARVASTKAILRDAGTWGATLLRRGRPESRRSLELEPETGEGILRVRIPPDARPKDRETIEVDVVPVDADGTEHPDRARHARVTVQAGVPTTVAAGGGGYVQSRDIRLASVHHDPLHPIPGSTVVTVATIRNEGGVPAPLRVVLLVDGHAVMEERIEVPPQSERPVNLPWTAGSGKNQVKVQVFLA